MDDSKIKFMVDDDTEVTFTIIEQAKLGGVNYLLVCEDMSDDEEEETDAYILKEINDESGEVTYEMLDDDKELQTISDYFDSLLEDLDVTL